MNIQKSSVGYAAWAIIGVPLVFAAFVQWSYQYSSEIGGLLPSKVLPVWLWYTAFAISLISGVFAVICMKFENKLSKIAVPTVYAIGMAIALLWAHYYVACRNGDCL